MPIFIRKFTFWFCILSLIVCVINFTGNDDKNILIFLTNPLNWILNDWLTKINMDFNTTQFFKPLLYILHLLFWVGLGLIFDGIIRNIKIKYAIKKEND